MEINKDSTVFDTEECDNQVDESKAAKAKKPSKSNYEVRKQIEQRNEIELLRRLTYNFYDD